MHVCDMDYIYLCFICLALAAVFIKFEHDKKYTLAVIFKGLASLTFVILGYLGSKICADAQFAKLVMIGLILGCVADVMLNLRFVFEKAGKKIFLVGILVFLSGHILYLAALLPKCDYLVICLIAGVVLTALTMKWIFTKISAEKAFKIFGIFYIGAIMIMTCVSIGNLISKPALDTVFFAVGAVLFLASDIVLILNTFGKESRFSLRVTNLSLYYLGQIMIALSLQLI